jgi:hypothetical protein
VRVTNAVKRIMSLTPDERREALSRIEAQERESAALRPQVPQDRVHYLHDHRQVASA